MPELPEVETVVRALRPQLVGRTIQTVRNQWPRHIATPDFPEMQIRLQGQQIIAMHRRAKYIVCHLATGDFLLFHLKMTGHLAVVNAALPPDKHSHTIFALDQNEELRFTDPRKFGRVYLVQQLEDIVGGLGPEPLEPAFTPTLLQMRLQTHKRAIKPTLLDQTVLAGIGNIYADEALHEAGIHPRRPANSLSETEVTALHAGIRMVLQTGIEREGASISSYVKPDGSKGDMQNAVAVFRRTGMNCYRCGRIIERIVLGGRSTHFCPGCQV
ncbi:MAG: bifunctional DNA-formamidopyrimidine glycosylase/DNA-(apurinic or apyrimidinic site) lyase [Chloroflexi bacterium]|nr:bifunctional DNA-formamidopyrimidine glycosylase/DNA-(apurinic or apyrimidinic site) lyase [Chloroflexota bacterium]MBP8058219.1 bifunctional DNA-formamidopyrimidine glycosylase/DNA-(apurinic or apyrimidinic site) lyase [Chloroflexota bacterium]